MCNFFQKSGSSKYWWKRFGYPYPVPVWKQFLNILFRLQTHDPAEYPTGKPDSDHLCDYGETTNLWWPLVRVKVARCSSKNMASRLKLMANIWQKKIDNGNVIGTTHFSRFNVLRNPCFSYKFNNSKKFVNQDAYSVGKTYPLHRSVIAWLESMTQLESRFLVTRTWHKSRWEEWWLESTWLTFFTQWLDSNHNERLESESFLENLWVPDGQTQFVCTQKISIFCYSGDKDGPKLCVFPV